MTLVRPKKRFLFGGAGLLLALAAVIILVLTQVQSSSATHVAGSPAHAVNQYSAKFLCGPIAGPADPSKPLAPGMYNTAINIHTANDFDVTIQKKAVISVEERTGQPNVFGLPSPRRTDILKADASMEVDCTDIAELLNLPGPPPANVICAPAIPPPPPVPPLGAWTSFCKGYAVIEAARINTVAPPPIFGVPAQLDVTNILTVKEEDGIWKDYTFNLQCNVANCPQIPSNPIRYSATGGVPPFFPMNLPVRPPVPPCYNSVVVGVACNLYDTDKEIHNGLLAYCQSIVGAINCANFAVGGPVLVDFKESDYATDARAVSLDFEFVNPKVVRYNCWPKGIAGANCP